MNDSRAATHAAIRHGLVSFFVLLGLLLSGCVSGEQYRGGAKHPETRIIENHEAEGYSIGFVELDEQGWLWGQKGQQMLQVQHLVAKKAQLLGNPPRSASGIILVAFVHD